MSEIIEKVQNARKLAQTSSLPNSKRIQAALQSLSGLTLSDLSSFAKEEVEAQMVGINQILATYDIETVEDYRLLSESDTQAILKYIVKTCQLGIDSESERVMFELGTAGRKLPIAAIEEVRKHPDVFTPLLIRSLESDTLRVRNGEETKNQASFFAVFLLTELEAHAAFPALLEILRLPGEGPFEILGDGVHELVAPIMSLSLRDNIEEVTRIVEDVDVNLYVRWCALRTYLHFVRDGLITRELAIEHLERHLNCYLEKDESEMLAAIICELGNLAAASSLESIRATFERRLVDESIVDLALIESQIADSEETVATELANCRPNGMPDTVAELSRWASFCEPSKSAREPAVVPEPVQPSIPRPHLAGFTDAGPEMEPVTTTHSTKIRRNDPCPCGSGKKFKKCCR